MRTTTLLSLQALGLWAVAEAYIIPNNDINNDTVKRSSRLNGRANDPTDFSWVKRWAAVGDSFTAGIGAGSPMGNLITDQPGDTNWQCSRYDGAYPNIINDAIGPSVEDFQFVACSGDRTGGIYNQIKALKGSLDLVVMTAGGNDLCLSGMIKECVFMPFDGEDACTSVIAVAQNNLNSIYKGNLVQLLDALSEKVNPDGVVVINGYAQFFNTQNEDCATKQNWFLMNLWSQSGLTLTIDRRKKFNDLVVQINNVIRDVVNSAQKDPKYKFKIGFSNWDVWPSQGVAGQFCDPSSTGHYPDPSQPDLQFFKPDTNNDQEGQDELKRSLVESGNYTSAEWLYRRQLWQDIQKEKTHIEILKSPLYRSANPATVVRRKLDRRFPSRPNCPGDEDVDVQPPSIGLPDFIAKNFHPNELGHYTIASFALQTIMDVRADVLDVDAPECPVKIDKFTCYQGTGSNKYANGGRLNENADKFCNDVNRPTGAKGWNFPKNYDEGTFDNTEFYIEVADPSTNFDKNQCLESIKRIINGCDGNDPKNPMDWKFGGEWIRGDYTYRVSPAKTRKMPVIQNTAGTCVGWYHGVWSSYEMQGMGWANDDYGQNTLLPSAKGCIGGGLTSWKFDYYDEITSEGYEWKASFSTPIWVRQRCFNNNKAQFAAGGFTNGCGGND